MKAQWIPTTVSGLLIHSLLWISACGQETSRQEKVDKLRAIGAHVNPLFLRPSSDSASPNTAQLTVYLAVPSDQTPVMSFYDDETFNNGFLLRENSLKITPDQDSFSEYNQIRIYAMTATISIPSMKELFRLGERDFYQVRYGVRVESDDEVEEIVGNFEVYPETASLQEWSNPSISISSPRAELKAKPGQELELVSDYSNPNSEVLKFGWFVTGGKVINRRASTSTWKAPEEKGPHTVMATVRGATSKAFALEAITINVE